MGSITRTVRFDKREAELIDAFLAQNEFLDFSRLTRLAVYQFIQNPVLKIRPVSRTKVKRPTRERNIPVGGAHG
jgi:hypothetical protein